MCSVAVADDAKNRAQASRPIVYANGADTWSAVKNLVADAKFVQV